MTNLVDTAKTWTLTIDGTNYQTFVRDQSLRVEDSEGSSVDTLSVEIYDYNNAFSFAPHTPVVWAANGSTVFDGFVRSASRAPNPGWQYRTWKIEAASYHDLLKRVETTPTTYADMTAGAILAQIFTDFELTAFDVVSSVEAGPTLETFYVSTSNILDTLDVLAAQAGGMIWRIDPGKIVVFQSDSSENASFSLGTVALSDWHSGGSIVAMESNGFAENVVAREFYNRIVVDLGDKTSDTITDTFAGDGSTYMFVLSARPVEDMISIDVDGTDKRFGEDGYDSIGLANVQVLVNSPTGVVLFAPGAPPGAGTTVTVKYRSKEQLVVTRTNATGYALAGDQWLTKRVRNSALATTAQAEAFGDAFLDEYGAQYPVEISCAVRRLGLKSGQRLTLYLPSFMGGTADYVIRSVNYQYASKARVVLCTLKLGTRLSRLSDFLTRSENQAPLAQPILPRVNSSVGTQRVYERIEVFEPGTVLDLTDVADLETLIS